MSTGIVILAAGGSARMGEPKQLLAYRGTTLLQHSLNTALTFGGAPVVVVLGAHAAEIRVHLGGTRALIVENPAWREGMGGSLRTGLRALLAAHPDLDAAIFLLCDQPLVSGAALRALVENHARTGAAIVASEYGGTLGVPALFTREIFPELLALDGDGGARRIIGKHRARVTDVPFPEGSVDIDTPADYGGLRQVRPEISTPTFV